MICGVARDRNKLVCIGVNGGSFNFFVLECLGYGAVDRIVVVANCDLIEGYR